MKKIVLFLIIALFSFAVSSCKKNKSILRVSVYDAFGKEVNKAVVDVSIPDATDPAKQKINLKRVGSTDAQGVVCFDFSEEYKRGSAGLFQLNVKVKKNNVESDDVITKIHENETTDLSVRLPN